MEKTAIVKIHPRSFSEEDLIINLDFFGKPKLQQGNLIQILLQDDQRKSLCLQVKELPLEIQPKGGAVTIGTAAAQSLGINGMTNVIIRKVSMQDVTIGLTQLKIKNQYIGQSDMWRLTNSLMDTCVYVGKTIQFAGIRVQVDKLWRQGEIVSSGAVASDSRVVFRSASAHMFLFIQVCAEITDFDSHGDQYFDKAMNGFMKELFEKLKENECNHLATIVLFWRTYYYTAKYKDDFPVSMRNSVLRDCKGRFYQDFYNVIGEIQTELESEWAQIIVRAKKAFMQHLGKTNCCEEESNLPEGTLSKSFQGNFLEVINLTTNALSTNHVDLNLTMTGQVIIIVTPGVGVFEVDRKMYAMTNSKVSDLCIGVDVICLTEQPFHAIPLLMFQSKSTTSEKEDFTTPDWMNYSFYNPQSVWSKGQFEPRIKLSDHLINKYLHNEAMLPPTPLSITPQSSCIRSGRRGSKASITDQRLLQRTDYDDHDEQIFQRRILVQHSISGIQMELYRHRSDEEIRIDYSKFDEETLSYDDEDDNVISTDSNSDVTEKLQTGKTGLTMELSSFTGSLSVTPRARFLSTGSNLQGKDGVVTGTTSNVEFGRSGYYSPQHTRRGTQRRKPIVNPFVLQKIHQNVTANQRKWMHVFPRNREGHAFQQHHDMSTTSSSASLQNLTDSPGGSGAGVSKDSGDSPSSLLSNKKLSASRLFGKVRNSEGGCQPIIADNFAMTRRMGTDWEAVVMPACLPITTDYFPSQKELEQKFSEYNYDLIQYSSPDIGEHDDDDDSLVVASPWSSPRKHMGPIESLREVISQRISLGFQLILDRRHPDLYQLNNELASFSKIAPDEDASFKVSLGRVHHRIVLTYPDIKIIMYNPAEKYKHNLTYQTSHHDYSYQLCAPCQQNFQTRQLVLKHEGVENFNWNYVDQHILGYQDFAELPESSRYQKFRCRYLLLPTEQMWVGGQDSQLVTGFVKLLDFLNHVKQRQHAKWNASSTSLWSTPRMSTPASPNASYDASRPVDISSKRVSAPQIGSYSASKAKLFDEDRTHMTKEPRMLSPESKTRQTTSRSSHPGVDATELLKPKQHLRQKSETDFLDAERRKSDHENERTSTLHVPDDCKVSLEELTELVTSGTVNVDKHELQRADSKSNDGCDKTSKQIKQHSSLTSLTSHGIIKTPPSSRRRGFSHQRSLDASDHHAESGSLFSPAKTTPFTTSSPMADIINALTNEETGMQFVTAHALGLQCFIAMEMVTWLLDNFDDIELRKQAVRFAQEMLDNRVIAHVSGDPNVTFKDGYHLFKVVKANDNRGGYWLGTHWFEVSILQPSQIESRVESLTTTPSSMSSTSSTQGDSLPYYMQDNTLEEQNFTDKTVSERSFVELTPDPQRLSDRPEWCFVYYDSTYHPSRSFEFEFQWVVSTAALLSQLVQNWSRKAHMYGFNLVRVPLFSSLSFDDGSSCAHPFHSPQHIPLCLPSECSAVGKQKGFVSAIAERFGFLPDLERNGNDDLNSSPSPQQNNTMYVHYTGSVLIKAQLRKCNQNTENHPWTQPGVVNFESNNKDILSTSLNGLNDDRNESDWIVCGFWWYNNHFADKTSITYDLFNSFQTFCQDLDKQLQKFCTQFAH